MEERGTDIYPLLIFWFGCKKESLAVFVCPLKQECWHYIVDILIYTS